MEQINQGALNTQQMHHVVYNNRQKEKAKHISWKSATYFRAVDFAN